MSAGGSVHEIVSCLDAIESELRSLAYWQETPPSPEALASSQPFCCDTLEFPQWLQFIFLHKMRLLLDNNAALPSACAIAPYAEEYFRYGGTTTSVLQRHLLHIDQLLTRV